MDSYSSLKTYIASRLDRTDLDSYIDSFISLAEAMFNRELRCREMITEAALTQSSGVAALPADYLQYRSLTPSVARFGEIKYIAPSTVNDLYASRPSGAPRHFTIIGGNLKLFPLSDDDVTLTYFQKIAGLNDGNTSNWLLAAHPDIYMHGILAEAYAFIGDANKQILSAQIVDRFIEDLREADEMANFAAAEMIIEGAA